MEGCIARSAALSRQNDFANRVVGGQWVKVATRKEAAPKKLKGIWLEELQRAAEKKSKAVKKRARTKVQKVEKTAIPEEMDVWTFWVCAKHVVLPPRKTTVRSTTCVWMSCQLGKHRAGWSEKLQKLSTKEVLSGAGNPSSVQASTGFKAPGLNEFQQFN